VNTLLLKVIVTPALIGTASLAGRRWGDSISGWLVALPLTTGPIAFFLALTHGTAFAAVSAAGTLAGGFSLAAFVLAYAWLAPRWKWLPTLAASILAFGLLTAVLQQVTLPLVPLYALVVLIYVLELRLLPKPANSAIPNEDLPPQWDIPLRMVIATAFVIFITAIAPAFGPHLTGLLSPFPIFTATLAAFAHHLHGGEAAIKVLRGLLMGLFAYASFFFTLAALLVPAGIAAAFAVAILVVIVFQSIALWLLRRQLSA